MSALRVTGSATGYRLYDVAYGIDLEQASRLLGESLRGRAVPQRLEARGIQIRNPPLLAHLGEREIETSAGWLRADLTAHLFDFGVCSMRATSRRGHRGRHSPSSSNATATSTLGRGGTRHGVARIDARRFDRRVLFDHRVRGGPKTRAVVFC